MVKSAARRVLLPVLSCMCTIPARAQTSQLFELTTENFVQAAKQPISWLINVEQPSVAQSRTAATMLRPALTQAVAYYHGAQQQKGVRVAHVCSSPTPYVSFAP